MRRPEWNGEDRTSSPLLGSKQKKISIRISFFVQSARRGSNPRPPPWQGGAPPLSHSRMFLKHLIQFEKEERETGIEPATPSLARRCSTAEPLAHILTTVDSISSKKHFVNNNFDFLYIFIITSLIYYQLSDKSYILLLFLHNRFLSVSLIHLMCNRIQGHPTFLHLYFSLSYP